MEKFRDIRSFGVLLKRSKNLSSSAVRHCPSSSALRPPILLTLPLSDLRPGANANPIKWGQSYTDVGLAPGRTSDVGQGQYQEKFFMVGRSVSQRGVGGESDGEGDCQTATADGRKFLLLFRTTRQRL